MRRFSPEYLRDTRRGLWEDRAPLSLMDLEARSRILDVGAGTGEFTRILRSESPAEVVAVDADPDLLRAGEVTGAVLGEATQLPFADGSFDLVVCQALLVNVPDPVAVIREFRRASSDLVAAVEPDNSGVTVDSTVPGEASLARRARGYYMAGLETDAGLGSAVGDLFHGAGLSDVRVRKATHERIVEPPYSDAAIESARRKVTGSRLNAQRDTMLQSDLDETGFEALLDEWRAMGREVVSQIGDGDYRRRASIPFYVTIGRTGGGT